MITVPDERLIELEKLVKPQKVVPTTVEIVVSRRAGKRCQQGRAWATSFLETYAVPMLTCCVLRCFDDDNVIHVDGSVNPVRDKEIIDTELQLKDLDSVEKLGRNEKL